MRIFTVLLAAFLMVGTAMAADIARGPEVVEGVDQGYVDQNNRGNVLIVNILEDMFTDVSGVYQTGLENMGHTVNVIYDPMGDWGTTSDYDAIFFLSSDNWWTSYNYSADMATAAAYVDGGGCLFAIGQDMLYGGGAAVYNFVTSYCGVVDVIEDVVFPGYMMDWEGTVGGPLEGVSEPGYVPCFGSNDWYTDEVFPASQGVVTFTMTDPPYGPAEGGSLADALFSTVEFGCTNFPDSVIPALMEFCGGATPAEDASWGSIKGQFK